MPFHGKTETGTDPRLRACYGQRPVLALLRLLVVPLVREEPVVLRRAPELFVLVPIAGLWRHAPALLYPELRLNFASLLEGWRRFEALARTVFVGLLSLLVPRLGLFRTEVDRLRKSCFPRFVNLDPSIPVVLAVDGPEGLIPLGAGPLVLVILDRRETVIVPSGALVVVVTPASLIAALFHRPSISLPFFIAQLSKSSEAEAGTAAAINRIRNNGTIDALM